MMRSVTNPLCVILAVMFVPVTALITDGPVGFLCGALLTMPWVVIAHEIYD